MENFAVERKELGGGVDAKKPKTRQLVDEKNEPPSLTTRSHSPLFSSQKNKQNKKQWAKVASVPVERMHAIKAAFLDEV